MKSGMIYWVSFAVVVAVLTVAAPAFSHSFPEKQSPAAGETVTSPPSEVSIKYDAPIEKLFASLQVMGPDGKDMATDKPQVSADGYTLSVKVGKLGPGDYKVKWGVIGIDTHHTQGSYTFTVASKGA
jgi:methionine-rich copper-binding protein CopC